MENTKTEETFEEKFLSELDVLWSQKPQGKAAYAMMMLTDQFQIEDLSAWGEQFRGKSVKTLSEEAKEILKNLQEKALEIRLFHEKGEIKWFRSSINQTFCERSCLGDETLEKGSYWDENQYLDIDEKKTEELRETSNSSRVAATGGGCYNLPGVAYQDAMIKIRNYLEYEPNGRCYIRDWRIVGFIKEKGGETDAIY